MKKIIHFSIHHPVSVLMYFALAMLFGLAATFYLNAAFLPAAKERFIIVSASYKGARAKEIRRLISIPLEENLASVKGIKSVESLSRDGSAVITLELKWSADENLALLETKALLDSSGEFLPQDCPKPLAQKAPPNESEAMRILVIPKNGGLAAASRFAENELKRKILSLEESARADVFGGQSQEIKVVVDSKRAAFYGLSLQNIAAALSLSNFDYPAGTLQDGDDDVLLKTEGSFKNFSDILETPLKTNKGLLKLKRVARVEKSDARFDSFCFYNGKRCAAISVYCKQNKSPLRLAKKIRSLLAELESDGKNYDLVFESDSSEKIRQSVKGLALSAALGVLISFVILLFFFRSAKIALAVSGVIPGSLLATALCLLAFKRSLNIISISGMTICAGMIIDNGIVAMESALQADGGPDFLAALEKSFLKVSLSNSASSLTSAIVFLPLFFIGGIIGELFYDLALAVVSGTLFSLAYAFTALPAFCALFFKGGFSSPAPAESALERKVKKIQARAKRIPFLCPAALSFFVAATAALLLPIKKEMQAKSGRAPLAEEIFFQAGTSPEAMARKTRALCERLKEVPGVRSAFARGGAEKNDWAFFSKAQNRRERAVITLSGAESAAARESCQKIFDSFGLAHKRKEPLDLISERLSLDDSYLFFSDSEEALYEEAASRFGSGNITPNDFSAQRTFVADKALMEKLSLSAQGISQALRAAFDGEEAAPYSENGTEIPMKVQFEKNEFSSTTGLGSVKALLGRSPVELSSLGEWQERTQEAALYRKNGRDAKIVRADAALRFLSARPGERERRRLLSLKKEGLRELFSNAAFLLCVSLLLLYCVLGAQTESFLLPILFFSALPPAFFGAALFLSAFGSSLNVNSIVAFVVLFGTCVNNPIILYESGGTKIRTVLITSATSIASLVPFAFDPFKKNPQSCLALAVAGGLLFSAASVLLMAEGIFKRRPHAL